MLQAEALLGVVLDGPRACGRLPSRLAPQRPAPTVALRPVSRWRSRIDVR